MYKHMRTVVLYTVISWYMPTYVYNTVYGRLCTHIDTVDIHNGIIYLQYIWHGGG